MKRDQFVITSTAGHHVTKYAWNACIREIEDLVRSMARNDNTSFVLVGAESFKQDSGHYAGSRTWSNSKTGAQIRFEVSKVSLPPSGRC